MNFSPQELASVLLVIVGVILSFVFKYSQTAKKWYDAQTNKGPLMFAMIVATAGVYFLLSCTPFAVDLGIYIPCNEDSIYILLRAIALISLGNTGAYLYSGGRPSVMIT